MPPTRTKSLRVGRHLTVLAGAAALCLGLAVPQAIMEASSAAAQVSGAHVLDAALSTPAPQPCDIYDSGGTPCVAAHSTTRALYAKYRGPLYQLRRASDGRTKNVYPVAAGQRANSATQDAFCVVSSCQITTIYDQSGRGNHLTQAPPGGFDGPASGGRDNLADAAAAPINVGGSKVYGVYIAPGTGYRNNNTNGVATGDQPEGMYSVLDGEHFNDGCCFDYGNAETDSRDDGNGTMEAIYFGSSTGWGSGTGNGPWIMADLENGLFSGVHSGVNNSNPSITWPLVTAMVKGGADQWAIRGGNAQSGNLSTFYLGARPNEAPGYNPMQKQGAIILGIGGDNSNASAGTFYEGVMTSGYPTEEAENSVQQNITAAQYTKIPIPLRPGPAISLSSSKANLSSTVFAQHQSAGAEVVAAGVKANAPLDSRRQATFIESQGLSDPGCYSFQSIDRPSGFLRHRNFRVSLEPNDGGSLFTQDATFCAVDAGNGSVRLQSKNFPDRYVRRFDGALYLAADGGPQPWDVDSGWSTDTLWFISKPLAAPQ